MAPTNIISYSGGSVTISYTPNSNIFNCSYSDLLGPVESFTIPNDEAITVTNTSTNNDVLTIQFVTNILITSSNFYFIIGSEYITIDGGNTRPTPCGVNFDVLSYPGLVQNGTSTTTGLSNITIQNITTFDEGSSTLAVDAGWVCQTHFGSTGTSGNASSYIQIQDCTNYCSVTTGTIYASPSNGGIVGSNFCYNLNISNSGSNCIIQNCVNEGPINGSSSGGIAGSRCFGPSLSTNTNKIYNCINNGNLTGGTSCGGIVGSSFCKSINSFIGNYARIEGCANSGSISNSYCGGILGPYSAATITNCSNTGTVSANTFFTGGIFATESESSSTTFITITNCYTVSGLIAGNTANVSITSCYVVSNGTWSNTEAESNLILTTPNGSSKPYYWTYSLPVGQPNNPFLIASLSNNTNYVTSIPTPTPTPVYTSVITTTVPLNAGERTLDIPSNGVSLRSKLYFSNQITPSQYNIRTVTGFGSVIVSRSLTYSFPIGSLIYVYPEGTSDSVILAEQNQPVPIHNICFLKNTPIETDQGIILIYKIDPKIHTINNKKIVAVTKTVTDDNYLICFEKHALGNNIPTTRTIVSKYHKIQDCNGEMIQAREYLKNYENVKKIDYNDEILYNILMEEHETINVNNLVCETLHPDDIIAKLYTSKYSEEEKNKIIISMNYCKKQNKKNTYRKIVDRLFIGNV